MLAPVPVIYWYITNHLKTKQVKTIAIIYFAHKSVIWARLGGDSFISILCGIAGASPMGQEVLLPRWFSHRAGKLVVVVDGQGGALYFSTWDSPQSCLSFLWVWWWAPVYVVGGLDRSCKGSHGPALKVSEHHICHILQVKKPQRPAFL